MLGVCLFVCLFVYFFSSGCALVRLLRAVLSGAFRRSPASDRMAPINHPACRFSAIGCTGDRLSPVITYSDTVISRFGSGLLWLSVALAIGSPGMLPLWPSICLHISLPFSGGMVVNFHFILFHHITWS